MRTANAKCGKKKASANVKQSPHSNFFFKKNEQLKILIKLLKIKFQKNLFKVRFPSI